MTKTTNPLSILIAYSISLLFLSSCGMIRMSRLQKSALEDSPRSFVQTRDMQIIEVPDFTNLGIDPDSIIAKQTKHAYYRIYDGKEMVRMMKGEINMYYDFHTSTSTTYHSPNTFRNAPSYTGYPQMSGSGSFSTSTNVSAVRYFDLGLDTKPIFLSSNNLKPYISNCPTCQSMLVKYDRVEKQNNIWKYINWTATAGGLVVGLVSDPANMSDLEFGSFTGLFFGSIISGVFRRRAKGYNYWRLEDVIGENNKLMD